MSQCPRFLTFFAAGLAIAGPSWSQDATLPVATPLTEPGQFTGGIEGPACDREGNLYVVNFGEQGTIGKVTPDGKASLFVTLPEGSVGNGIRFDRQGVMYVADYVGHNILRVDPRTRAVTVFAHEPAMNQPNDLAIGPDGTLYASDPNWKEGTGQIWRIDRDGTVTLLAANLGTTNGIEVSPDGKTLYVNESVQRKLWAFTLTDEKTITDKWLVKEFADHGFDGMRCDVAGNLLVTRHGKGTVVTLSPKGEILGEIGVLGTKPSNLCFGGEDGRTVYVTEVDHTRVVTFRAERPGLAWRRWQESRSRAKAPASAAAIPEGMTVHRAVDYATFGDRKLAMEVFVPEGEGPFPGVLLVHGGGWIGGNRQAFEPFAIALAKRGYVVGNIEYRLATEAKFPGAVLDCKAAVRWLRAHADQYGYDAGRVGVCGTSAGGHLALLLGTGGGVEALEGEVGDHPEESSRVQAIVDYYGASDFILRSRTQPAKTEKPGGSAYGLLGGSAREQPEKAKLASAAWQVTEDDPPLLILHGEKDRTVLIDQAVRMRDAYRDAGLPVEYHPLPEAGHGGPEFFTGENRTLVESFFRRHLAGDTAGK